ncbi:hypothetical protein FEN17_10865 [Dyadobacter luticola]|uniref:DUF5672 domain-containing protein n=2 Tax=Dyadobacter luticola TaxID=1979387 RepID=A0A5R9KZ31_9BACT|nr:hypothetical protein FEN17_10865 [Dyadobacter luticola]
MLDKSSVAVVIPVYQPFLTENEEISLQQCLKVLAGYPIKIIKPRSLSVDFITKKYSSIEAISLDSQHFEGIAAYNRLLISLDFYKQFSAFKFMLIYQLDAFVFRDELLQWCQEGYDYIGAPSLHNPEFDILPAASAQTFADALSSRRFVLNGGLSLRHIPAFIRYLKIYNTFYPAWVGNEDMLFSQEATRLIPMKLFLKTPSWQEALRFAFEKSPAATYELTGHQLPFACHAWERYDPGFWSRFIPENQ